MDNTAVEVADTIIGLRQFLQGVKGILKENVIVKLRYGRDKFQKLLTFIEKTVSADVRAALQ